MTHTFSLVLTDEQEEILDFHHRSVSAIAEDAAYEALDAVIEQIRPFWEDWKAAQEDETDLQREGRYERIPSYMLK